jgi:hypothetical protein
MTLKVKTCPLGRRSVTSLDTTERRLLAVRIMPPLQKPPAIALSLT